MNEEEDKQAIREVIATWLSASAEGDIDRILPLMAADVVFLLPGQPPMRGRDAYAVAYRSMIGKVQIEGASDIQEIHIAGDYAFCWNQLSVTVTPGAGGPPSRQSVFSKEFVAEQIQRQTVHRAGPVLSVFRRESDGRWVLFRDANMLTAVE
ncbi:MAG TPA: SgcJ/EcaC family oxidoreductase [Alphaproteobacteria bacterium]|nr:SgcJ/EcaC family oxidoreductase [Alphaproteobacteria bacterium]